MFKFQESLEIVLMRPLSPKEDGEVMISCIAHDDAKPSLSFNVKDGVFFCHGCGVKGNFKHFCELAQKHLKVKGSDISMLIKKAEHLSQIGDASGVIFSFYISQKTDLWYEVRQVISTKNGIKVFIEVFYEGDYLFSNTPNLSASKTRREFANKIIAKAKNDFPRRYDKECKIIPEDVEDDLQHVLKRCEDRLSYKEDAVFKEEDRPTPEEIEEATKMLKNKDLMHEIQADMTKIGIIGEESNRLMIYLAGTSRLCSTPLSIVIKGSSSSGKSHLVSTVMGLMPRSSVFEFSYVSAKALCYMDNVDFEHKILVIYERSGALESDYNIRIMQSEGKLRIAVPSKDKATGRHKTLFIEIKGPIAYIETTTQRIGNPENETRVYCLFTDESEGQTKKIHDQQRAHYKGKQDISDEEKDRIKRKHAVAQQILKPYRVIIPYADFIMFPSAKVRCRRDLARFLRLISVITLLHQLQREKSEENGVESLIATVEDYRIAYDISVRALVQSMAELPFKSRTLLKSCRKQKGVFSRSDLEDDTGMSLDEIAKYIKPLIDYNYVKALEGEKGKTYRYKNVWPGDEDDFHMEGLTTPDELVARINQNKSKIKKLIAHSAAKMTKK